MPACIEKAHVCYLVQYGPQRSPLHVLLCNPLDGRKQCQMLHGSQFAPQDVKLRTHAGDGSGCCDPARAAYAVTVDPSIAICWTQSLSKVLKGRGVICKGE